MDGRAEVLIVGLGPAGAAAGITLARAGVRVLALDGHPEHPKPCGGCLSARAVDLLEGLLGAPEWLRACPVADMYLEAPGRPPSRCFPTQPAGAYFVERRRLDEFLRRRALEAGVRVVAERARSLEPAGQGWLARTRRQAWQGDWLLGADGAQGLSARVLGLGQTSFVYKALVEERPLPPDLSPDLEGAALLELGGAPGGYAWAFGRQGVLNLGLAGLQGRVGGTQALLAHYQAFLKRRGLGRPGVWRGALIPCPGPLPPRLVRGRAAVLGDAAAAADPFLGEGIGQAAASGLAAARAILAGDLGGYARGLRQGLLKEHRHARWLARLVYRAPRVFQTLAQSNPAAIELAWRVLRGQLGYDGIWRALARMLLGGGLPPPGRAAGLDR